MTNSINEKEQKRQYCTLTIIIIICVCFYVACLIEACDVRQLYLVILTFLDKGLNIDRNVGR